VEAARRAFDACLALRVRCIESTLAERERAAPPPQRGAPAPRRNPRRVRGAAEGQIYQTLLQTQALFQQGRYQQALAAAEQVRQAALRELGEESDLHAAALNLLGLVWQALGDLPRSVDL